MPTTSLANPSVPEKEQPKEALQETGAQNTGLPLLSSSGLPDFSVGKNLE